MDQRLPKISFGIPKLDRALESWRAAIRRASSVIYVHPLYASRTPYGTMVSIHTDERFFGKLTASLGGGAYSFVEVYSTSAGLWAVKTGGRSGTAYEFNANAGIPMSQVWYVPIRRLPASGDYRFQLGVC